MKNLIFVGFNGYFSKNLSRVSFCVSRIIWIVPSFWFSTKPLMFSCLAIVTLVPSMS
jgi:hypothetical protein